MKTKHWHQWTSFNGVIKNISHIHFVYCTNQKQWRGWNTTVVSGGRNCGGYTILFNFYCCQWCWSGNRNVLISKKTEIHQVIEEGVEVTLIMDEVSYVNMTAMVVSSVLSKGNEREGVKLKFLHPSGPTQSFVFLRHTDMLIVLRKC